MVILVSNDDGIHSDGIIALENALQHVGEVYTVAPDREQNSDVTTLTASSRVRVVNKVLSCQRTSTTIWVQ